VRVSFAAAKVCVHIDDVRTMVTRLGRAIVEKLLGIRCGDVIGDPSSPLLESPSSWCASDDFVSSKRW